MPSASMISSSSHYAFARVCVVAAFVFGVTGIAFGQQEPGTPSIVTATTQYHTPVAQISAKEQKVKAAYLYNFSRYFGWPQTSFESDDAPFVIGVLGSDPLGNQLDRLAIKKSVGNRKIVIHRFETVETYQPCQLLFVSRTVSDEQFRLALEQASKDHVLVVSEIPPETRDGSSVQIFIDQAGKVGFEIDVNVVSSRQLQVNAKLLKLASVYKGVATNESR